MKPLTVAQLIEALKTMPPDALVDMEGCDCSAYCVGVNTEYFVNAVPARVEVLLRRKNDGIRLEDKENYAREAA